MSPDEHRDAAWDALNRAKDYPVTDPRTAFLLEALFHATLAGPVPPVDVFEIRVAESSEPVATLPAPPREPAPAAPRKRTTKARSTQPAHPEGDTTA